MGLRKANEKILGALSRVTSSGRYLAEIDGLRFIAILSVVMYHLNGFALRKIPSVRASSEHDDALAWLFSRGHYGVQLFFIISGFIIAMPFVERWRERRPPVRLRPYFLRRVTRLEPPYLINLCLALALLVVVQGQEISQLLPNLFASMIYQHNLIFGRMSEINGVAWSLEVEVQFYVLAPLLLAIYLRLPARTRPYLLLTSIAVICVSRFAAPTWRNLSPATLLSFVEFFLTGILICDLRVAERNGQRRRFRWDCLAGIGWGISLAATMNEQTAAILPLTLLIAVYGSLRGPVISQVLRIPWIATIGAMCYTIYLYHFYVLSLMGQFTTNIGWGSSLGVNTLLQSLFILPAVLAICAVLYLLFEKPFMYRQWPSALKQAILARSASNDAASEVFCGEPSNRNGLAQPVSKPAVPKPAKTPRA